MLTCRPVTMLPDIHGPFARVCVVATVIRGFFFCLLPRSMTMRCDEPAGQKSPTSRGCGMG